eukprot:8717620-Alexandrium_andersonii.AAC.1
MVRLMAVKYFTVQEHDYLATYGAALRHAWGDEDSRPKRAAPFAMVWDAGPQLTRRICEADLYIPASGHESDHV